MEKAWSKILQLVKETGDRLVVTDPDGENVFVVMTVEDYQNLRGIKADAAQPAQSAAAVKALTEEQLLNRINREIDDWKSVQEAQDPGAAAQNLIQNLPESRNQELMVQTEQPVPPKEEQFYFEPVDDGK